MFGTGVGWVRLDERTVIRCLRTMLPQIHPLDYEKVRYACNWLSNLLALCGSSEEEEDGRTTDMQTPAAASGEGSGDSWDVTKTGYKGAGEEGGTGGTYCRHYFLISGILLSLF